MTQPMLFDTEYGEGPPRRTGHAETPGTGPAGESCSTCRYYRRIQYANVYLKCGLQEHRWTSGPGTDVKAHDPACRYWELREEMSS